MTDKVVFPPFGSFFGDDLTDFQCEVLQIERFGNNQRAFRKHFRLELQLFQSKWFDYRLLHPVMATYLYAAEFIRAYRRYYSMTIDCEKGQYVKGFKGNDALQNKQSISFIRGRQAADELGIPYWFYIEKAYEWLYIKKWKHIPRHVHLYAEDVIEYVSKQWEARIRETLIIAESDFFRDEINGDRPEYKAHQEWLRERVKLSSVPKLATESLNERGYCF